MMLRRVASALSPAEKGFKRIMGDEQMWRMEWLLKNQDQAPAVDAQKQAG
jgi:hypothetical protein